MLCTVYYTIYCRNNSVVVCCSEQTVFSHFTSKTPVNLSQWFSGMKPGFLCSKILHLEKTYLAPPSDATLVTSHNVSFAKYTEPLFIILSFFSLFVIEKLLCFYLSDRWLSQILTGCCESTCNIISQSIGPVTQLLNNSRVEIGPVW